MFLLQKLSTGEIVALTMDRKVVERLQTKHFRGTDLACAGNFRRWNSPEAFWEDPTVLAQVVPQIEQRWGQDLERYSFCFDYGVPVGWSSTAPAEQFDPEALERFEPNCRSAAFRVKLDRRDLTAPLTRLVTVIYEPKMLPSGPAAMIKSIYPGPDVGRLVEHVTHRTRLVFFDWDHPGA